MNKLNTLIVAVGLAGAGFFLAPANSAENEGCVSDATAAASAPDAGLGDVCGGISADGTGYVYVDGAESNEDPLDGFISVANDGSQDEDGACASAQGDPGEEFDDNGVAVEDDDETPACNDALPQAVADQVTSRLGV